MTSGHTEREAANGSATSGEDGEGDTLYRLLYRSNSRIVGTPEEVEAIVTGLVEASNHANAAIGVTGALLMLKYTFIQALEGPPDALEQVFERICCDLRHQHVKVIEFAPIETRLFGAWGMTKVISYRSADAEHDPFAGLERAFAPEAILPVMRDHLTPAPDAGRAS